MASNFEVDGDLRQPDAAYVDQATQWIERLDVEARAAAVGVPFDRERILGALDPVRDLSGFLLQVSALELQQN